MATNANWNDVCTHSCANIGFNVFTDKINELFNERFPQKNICITNKEKCARILLQV